MKKILFFLSISVTLSSVLLADETRSGYVINYKAPAKETFDPNPYVQLEKVIRNAQNKGIIYPNTGILATADKNCQPYTRCVGISKITPEGLVFFTDPGSGKWQQLRENQKGSFVIYTHEYEPSIYVVINGTIDINHNDPRGKSHKVTVNGVTKEFNWTSFLFKPTEFVFKGEVPGSQEAPYRIAHSYAYKKGADGSWVISDSAKYYPVPEETNMFPLPMKK